MTEVLWVEKHRPKTIARTILPKGLKERFQAMVDAKSVPNIILAGRPGCGKTTVAKAMVEEIGSSYMVINGSLDATKDTLRTDIRDYAMNRSMRSGRKYVILDEADNLPHGVQDALRNFMEEYSANAGFILTCNHPNKITDALISRCPIIDFAIPKDDRASVMKDMLARCVEILKTEGVQYDLKVLAELLQRRFPDFRNVIGELQFYSSGGAKIDAGILVDFGIEAMKVMLEAVKTKNMSAIRTWVSEVSAEESHVYTTIYNNAAVYFKPESVPPLILILARYQYQSAFAINKDINLAAALIEIAMECEFK